MKESNGQLTVFDVWYRYTIVPDKNVYVDGRKYQNGDDEKEVVKFTFTYDREGRDACLLEIITTDGYPEVF